MHLMTMMQQQKLEQNVELDQNDGKNEHRLIVPRQFMDLGLANAAVGTADTDEASLSSSEGRSGYDGSRSPMNNIEGSGRDDSPEKGSQAWCPNKVPRLGHPSKNVDQATEATMRKARVSVRARSEAPMVRFFLFLFFFFKPPLVCLSDWIRSILH